LSYASHVIDYGSYEAVLEEIKKQVKEDWSVHQQPLISFLLWNAHFAKRQTNTTSFRLSLIARIEREYHRQYPATHVDVEARGFMFPKKNGKIQTKRFLLHWLSIGTVFLIDLSKASI
jgi:hypothetical protein